MTVHQRLCHGGRKFFGFAMAMFVLSVGWSCQGTEDPQSGSLEEEPVTASDTHNQEEPALSEDTYLVIAHLNSTWETIGTQASVNFHTPTFVVYREGTPVIGCMSGGINQDVLYCPGTERIHIDPAAEDRLEQQFGQAGPAVLAYELARAMTYHIQKLNGGVADSSGLEAKDWEAMAGALELQADFYVGVWMHYLSERPDSPFTRQDMLNSLALVVPSDEDKLDQRVHWFNEGYRNGDIRQGDVL